MKNIKYIVIVLIGIIFNSCSEDFTVIDPIEKLNVASNNSFTLIGETVIFSSFTNSGINVTNESTFFVNGEPIVGNSFSSNTVGEYSITSKYFSTTSEPLTITFHDGSQVNFKKRVLIEDYTGTWCGYCTRVAYALDLVHNQTDDAVAVAIHRSSSNPSSSSYDPYNFDSSIVENTLIASGYPKGFLNRKTQWNFPEPDNLSQVIGLTQGANPKLGLAIESNINGNNIELDVQVKFSNNFSNLKLVVYVLENGLIYDQKNYTSYYNGVNPLPNYTHNHVLRSCLTNLLGDSIDSSSSTSGTIYNRTFNIPIPSNIANNNNIEFVAFIVDENGNALNVRKASRIENQTFEEI